MEYPIFFTEYLSGNVITLTEETSKHVVQVLRMQTGEQLYLTDGAGNLWTAVILDAHKKKCSVHITASHHHPKPAKKISIAISLIKNNSRFEWFLEKATEVGVTEIIPMLCTRTEKLHFRHDRMQQILISAMIQSKQVWLPVLHQPASFEQIILSASDSTQLIAHCIEDDKRSIKEFTTLTDVQIMIGPEGDFTKEEIELAISKGFNAVSLGNTRLRTETAGIVAAAWLCG